MINDVSGLRDPAMVELVVESGCEVCIMHMLGEPGNMQDNPEYGDVNSEVNQYLISKARELVELEHPMDKIYLDPGIGFGRNLSTIFNSSNQAIACDHTLFYGAFLESR